MTRLTIDFAGITLRNPFVIGAGPYSCDASQISKNMDRIANAGWGGVVLKSITCERKLTEKRYGARPHIFPVRGGKGLIGMQNWGPFFSFWPDIELSLGGIIEAGKNRGLVIIPSVIAQNIHDWVYLACKVEENGAAIVELDLSCPHSPERVSKGQAAVTDLHPELVEEVVSSIKSRCGVSVIAKLGPNLYDLSIVARAAEKGGASGITAVNTVLGLSGIDIETGIPLSVSGNNKGICSGLSGDLLRPIGLRCVAQIASSVKIPILGVGGISTWQSAVEYLMVGATGLEVCTAVMLRGFKVVCGILEGLRAFMERQGYRGIDDFRGKSLQYLTDDFYQLSRKPLVAMVSEKCDACGLCVTACADGSAGAIMLRNDQTRIDKNLCIGCGLCKTICPSSAIELVSK
jgi:dihydropyrimidine dehydrogenase (NAD+) subunit PreA